MSNLTFDTILDAYKNITQKIIYYQVSEFIPKYSQNIQKLNGKMTFSDISGEPTFMMVDMTWDKTGKVLLLHPDWLEKYKDDIEKQGYKMIEYLGQSYELVFNVSTITQR